MRQTSATSDRSAAGTALAGALLHLVEQERERLVEELDGLDECVGVSGLEGLLRVQHPVLPQRVLDDELHRLLGPDELRDELRAAPAGMRPRNTSGHAKWRTDDAIVR